MKELIEALTILSKYTNDAHPTSCEHDVLYVHVDPCKVSVEDTARLNEIGFKIGDSYPHAVEPYGHFYSYRFGSA